MCQQWIVYHNSKHSLKKLQLFILLQLLEWEILKEASEARLFTSREIMANNYIKTMEIAFQI